MRICAIGDPHGRMDKIRKIPLKKVDLILLTGDLGGADLLRTMAFENITRRKQGRPEKIFSLAQHKKAWMEAYTSSLLVVNYLRRFAPVYTIFGNVESSNADTRRQSKWLGVQLPFLYDKLNAMHNVRIINYRKANVKGMKIGGIEYFLDTNWVQDFKPSDYAGNMAHAKKAGAKTRKTLQGFGKVNILVCHQPPYGILDKVTASFAPKHWRGKHAGSKAILDYVKRRQPRYVFCGHIHEGEGRKKVGKTIVYNLGVAGHTIVEI